MQKRGTSCSMPFRCGMKMLSAQNIWDTTTQLWDSFQIYLVEGFTEVRGYFLQFFLLDLAFYDNEYLSLWYLIWGVVGVCYLRYGTLEVISKKQHFIVRAQTQGTHVQRLSPQNKGVSPYIPLQAGYRSKKQGLVHIWLYLILLPTLL
jgi:hypothetical protein